MAPLNDMSAPGTASYDSDTMKVGDGTWDFTKDDFLLPNLVGLNFETMQYNGEYPGWNARAATAAIATATANPKPESRRNR